MLATVVEGMVTRRKSGRKPKHRIDQAYLAGPVDDLGPREIWDQGVVIRAAGAEVLRSRTIHAIVVRARTLSDSGRVIGEGAFRLIQTPIDKLFEEGHLRNPGAADSSSDAEAAARRRDVAERLAGLYHDGEMETAVTASWNSAGGGGLREKSDHAAQAEIQYLHALNEIRPYDALISAVCCRHIEPPYRRVTFDLVRAGLDRLATHFEATDRSRLRLGQRRRA